MNAAKLSNSYPPAIWECTDWTAAHTGQGTVSHALSRFPPDRPQSGGVRLPRRYAPGRRRRTFFKRGNIMATDRLSRTQKRCLKRLKRQSYPHRYSRNGNGQRHQRRKPRAKQACKSREELVSTKNLVCCKKEGCRTHSCLPVGRLDAPYIAIGSP